MTGAMTSSLRLRQRLEGAHPRRDGPHRQRRSSHLLTCQLTLRWQAGQLIVEKQQCVRSLGALC